MVRVFLGLGSNLGDRAAFLKEALREISELAPVVASSPVYETEPVGMESENRFYNMVVEIETSLRPPELLRKLKAIERKAGRRHATHLLDREIDIDILLYEGIEYADETVRVPHPQLEHRRFALEPFRDIAPLVVHPVRNQTIASLLRLCRDSSHVVRTGIEIEPLHHAT
jgi:2-amino-4-hydroxy-6-hydroxymethyldihydropteridine diphosphokinase